MRGAIPGGRGMMTGPLAPRCLSGDISMRTRQQNGASGSEMGQKRIRITRAVKGGRCLGIRSPSSEPSPRWPITSVMTRIGHQGLRRVEGARWLSRGNARVIHFTRQPSPLSSALCSWRSPAVLRTTDHTGCAAHHTSLAEHPSAHSLPHPPSLIPYSPPPSLLTPPGGPSHFTVPIPISRPTPRSLALWG